MKKQIAGFLAATMLTTLTPTVALASNYTDMPIDWSKSALESAISNGLLKGDNGKIMPNAFLTRAQMATMVNRAFGTTEKASLSNFVDVPNSAWYYDEMAKALHMQTFMGEGNQLNPDNFITREEAFTVLVRAFKLSDASCGALNTFSDKDTISSWAKSGISALVSSGYVSGFNGQINPKQNITRAEFSKIMDNLVNTYIQKADTYSKDAKGNVMINAPGAVLKNMTISGNLIIGDGVGNGDVTLENVIVTGTTIVRGGGVHSIRITGTSDLKNIVVVRVDGEVRVYAENGTQVGTVVVDGKDDVIIEGKVGEVKVDASNVKVIANNATIGSVILSGDQSTMVANDKVTIASVVVNAKGSEIVAEKNATIKEVVANQAGAKISGTGTVSAVKANANDVVVSTPSTSVTAAQGTTGVMAGTSKLDGGKTTSVSGSSSTTISGGGGGGGGGSSSSIAVSAINVIASDSVVNGGTIQFVATVTPSNATNKTIVWTVTNGTGSATIDVNGVLTGTKTGTVTVTALNVVSGVKATKAITVIIVSKTALTAAITDEVGDVHGTPVYVLSSGDYTTASWGAYSTAVTEAIRVEADKNAVQSTIDSTAATIGTKKAALIFANKAAMDLAEAAAKANVTSSDYTAASWSAFTAARTTALAMQTTTNAEMGARTNALNAAVALLKTDKTALTAAITDEVGDVHGTPVYVLSSGDYTTASWGAYSTAVTEAIRVEADKNAVQSTIDSAAATIGTKKAALIFANKAAMDLAEAAANSKVTSSDYTAESWSAFTAARTTALALPTTTNAEMGARTNALNAAMALLVETVPETLTSIEITDFNYETIFATQAKIISKTINATTCPELYAEGPDYADFSGAKSKSFIVTDSSGNSIAVNLNWKILLRVNDQPATAATVIGSCFESDIQQYFVDKGGANGLANRTLWASGSGDNFSIGAFGAGPTGKITITGSGASYLFDTLQAVGTGDNTSKNKTITINDGTSTATIALSSSYADMDHLVGAINNQLGSSFEVYAVKVDASHFKLATRTRGVHFTIDGASKAFFFNSFVSQQ